MAINFPNAPVDGELYEGFVWNATEGVWLSVPSIANGAPAGSTVLWPTNTAPAGWLLADGSAVSRTTYASLFAVIGTTYGSGDGSTTFNLPNLKGRVAVGRDAGQTEFDVLGETGGEKAVTLTEAQMPSHSHNMYGGQTGQNLPLTNTGNVWTKFLGNTMYKLPGDPTMTSTGGGQAHNNLQPYIVLNYIIKHTNGDDPGDSQLTQRVNAIESHAASQNLIINGHFGINQRGYTSGSSLASGVYGFDRWKSGAAGTTLTFTAAPNGQMVTLNSGGVIQQVVERGNVLPGTYTLSWSGTALGRVYNSGATAPAYAASPVTVSLDGSANVVVEFQANGGTRTLGYVQVELGTVATPFRLAGGSVQGELAACQRYYYRIAPIIIDQQLLGSGMAYTGTSGAVFVNFPVTMRTAPTVTTSAASTFYVWAASGQVAQLTSITPRSDASHPALYRIDIGVASGLTAGQALILHSRNTLSAFIEASAEL
jgi:microcystin-dependent protein